MRVIIELADRVLKQTADSPWYVAVRTAVRGTSLAAPDQRSTTGIYPDDVLGSMP